MRRLQIRRAPTAPGTGGYLFAADPRHSVTDVPIYWDPAASPSVMPLAMAPTVNAQSITLRQISASASQIVDDLRHLLVGRFERAHRLVVPASVSDEAPLQLALPLDSDTPARLRAVSHFWRHLATGNEPPPDTLTTLRATRLTHCLQALDGKLAGGSIRDVASALFGVDQLDLGRDWRTHDLRSRTRRLIDEGVRLMRGGYVELLRPPLTSR